MLTTCLWTLGIAPTSPDPLWHPDGLSMFDASSSLLPDPISSKSIPIKVSRYLGNVLGSVAGFCNALCKVSLSAGLHRCGQRFHSFGLYCTKVLYRRASQDTQIEPLNGNLYGAELLHVPCTA